MTSTSVFEIQLDEPLREAAMLLAPVAPATPDQTVVDTVILEAALLDEITAVDGARQAYRIRAEAGSRPLVRYVFTPSGGGLPEAAFVSQGSRFETLEPALAAQIAALASGADLASRVRAQLQAIADRFTYGRRDLHLGAQGEGLPAFGEEPTTGTCVDIHSVCVAALRAIGAPAAYVIGGWVREGDPDRPTGHCWLSLNVPDLPAAWDVSHHLEFGLGAIEPGLNPEPGRRFALSYGRAPVFEAGGGQIEILPALSGFHWADGPLAGVKLRTIGRFV
jgi:transglutaminase-like putative cysteine protease